MSDNDNVVWPSKPYPFNNNPLNEDDDFGRIRDLINKPSKPGDWVSIDDSRLDEIMEKAKAYSLSKDIPDGARLDDFMESALKGVIRSFRDYWVENGDSFRGIFVDPKDFIEKFTMRCHEDDKDVLRNRVSFYLDPEPFFQKDSFSAYGIRLLDSGEGEGAVRGQIRLYGQDFIDDDTYPDSKKYADDIGCMFPDFKRVAGPNEYRKPHAVNHRYWLFNAAQERDEYWWHRVVLQSIMHHDMRGDNITRPMQAFLRVANHREIPSEKEFKDALSKIKLMEGLQ